MCPSWLSIFAVALGAARAQWEFDFSHPWNDLYHSMEKLGNLEPPFRNETCDLRKWVEVDEQKQSASNCTLRDVYLTLHVPSYLEIVPNAVWVQRCVGTCQTVPGFINCGPASKVKREVPVKVYNKDRRRNTCGMYKVIVHRECKCNVKSDD